MQSVQLIYGHSQCKTIPFTGNGADAWPGVSEVEDEVGCGGELVGVRPIVVGGVVPGMIEANLGAKLDGGSEPLIEGDRVLGVAGLLSGTLTFFVVEKVGAEGKIAV